METEAEARTVRVQRLVGLGADVFEVNRKHCANQAVASLNKATIRELCDQRGIKTKTSTDRAKMAEQLADHIEDAAVVILWHEKPNNRLTGA